MVSTCAANFGGSQNTASPSDEEHCSFPDCDQAAGIQKRGAVKRAGPVDSLS